ncbi:MAG TPA: hypothetical protein VIT23_15420, partial [Terrimicrobiaceae bacterium]
VTVATQVSALLEFLSGPIATATFSFDAPVGTRELEVHGTEAAIRLPDPNRFDGSSFLCRKDSLTDSDEWMKLPRASDWEEVPAAGSDQGRGMGALDMARSLRSGGMPRAGADLAIHVLNIMESIAASAASRETIALSTTFDPSELLPTGWNPLQRTEESSEML